MTVIPQEIYDEIIDHLHGNNAALSTCALVCRAWVPSSRRHLFSEVHITINKTLRGGDIGPRSRCAVRFLDILSFSEQILPFIRKVHVYFAGEGLSLEIHCLTEALTILRDAAPRYQSITLRSVNHTPLKLHEILPLRRLTEFVLEFGYNLRGVALCAEMPCLQKLRIFGKPVSSGDLIKEKIVLPQLRSLFICPPEGDILRNLAPPMLREMAVGVVEHSDILCIGAFLRPLVADLEHLHLIWGISAINDDSMQQLGLCRMAHLRSLFISLRTTQMTIVQDCKSVFVTLDNVTSCMVDHIKFAFQLEASFAEDYWVDIPAILERPNFRSMHKLEFQLFGRNHIVTETETWILQQLHALEARHILHISHGSYAFSRV